MSLDRVRIVLVEPEFSGNIGSAARALKTMGLSQLLVVNPQCEPRGVDAVRMSHNSLDLVQKLKVVDRLETALAGTVFSVATTRRVRRQGAPFLTPEEAARMLLERARNGDVAIVFGRESSGLDNRELEMCSMPSTVPLATENQSLNLAQAVMVYAYAMYQASLEPTERLYAWQAATHEELEQFYAHLARALVLLGSRPASSLDNYVARFRRVISRMPIESRDVRLLRKIFTRIEALSNAGRRSTDSLGGQVSE